MKYIDADKLIAEIERRLQETNSMKPSFDQFWAGQISAFKGVKTIIASLQQEQREVDLDDVIENYILENFGEPWDGCVPVGCFELDQMAEHFYRLGLNARKEE